MEVVCELRLVGQAGDLVVVAVLEVRAQQRLGEHPDREQQPAAAQRARGVGDRPRRIHSDGNGTQKEEEEAHAHADREPAEASDERHDGDCQPGQRRATGAAGDGDADSKGQLRGEPAGDRPVLGSPPPLQVAIEVDREDGRGDEHGEWPPADLAG